MEKWSEKHMYNWIGWIESLIDMRERIIEWTISPRKVYKLPIYILNDLILSPLMLITIALMTIPQTIEWAMSNLMLWVNHELSHNNTLDGLKGFPILMVTLFILIPYTVTWGLPKLIGEVKQRRIQKRLHKLAEELRQVDEDRRRWEYKIGMEQAIEEQIRWRRERQMEERMKPKKNIKPFNFYM